MRMQKDQEKNDCNLEFGQCECVLGLPKLVLSKYEHICVVYFSVWIGDADGKRFTFDIAHEMRNTNMYCMKIFAEVCSIYNHYTRIK